MNYKVFQSFRNPWALGRDRFEGVRFLFQRYTIIDYHKRFLMSPFRLPNLFASNEVGVSHAPVKGAPTATQREPQSWERVISCLRSSV